MERFVHSWPHHFDFNQVVGKQTDKEMEKKSWHWYESNKI